MDSTGEKRTTIQEVQRMQTPLGSKKQPQEKGHGMSVGFIVMITGVLIVLFVWVWFTK